MMVRSILMSRPVQDPQGPKTRKVRTARTLTWPFAAFALAGALAIAGLTLDRMGKLPDWLARLVPGEIKTADLRSFANNARAPLWVPYYTMRAEKFAKWCLRPDTPICPRTPAEARRMMENPVFENEFREARNTFVASLPTANITSSSLVGADLSGSNLAGVRTKGMDLTNADFSNAILEGVVWSGLTGKNARFIGADLRGAKISFEGNLGGDFTYAAVEEATISFDSAWPSQFKNTLLDETKLVGTIYNVVGSTTLVFGADLTEASLPDAYLDGQMIPHIHTRFVTLAALNDPIAFAKNPFQSVELKNGAVRNFDFQLVFARLKDELETNNRENFGGRLNVYWRSLSNDIFGDGSSILPDGMEPPCHWSSEKLDTFEFLAAWKAWRISRGLSELPHAIANSSQSIRNSDGRVFSPAQIPASDTPISAKCR